MRHRDHGSFLNLGMQVKTVLYLFGADIFTTPDDDVFFTIRDEHRSLGRLSADVSRMEKTILCVGLCILIRICVTQKHTGTTRSDLSILAIRDLCALVIDNTHFISISVAISGGRQLGVVQPAQGDDGRLGAPIHANRTTILQDLISS